MKNNSHSLSKNVLELSNKPWKHLMDPKDGDGNLRTAPDEVLKCGKHTLRNILTRTGEKALDDIANNIPGLVESPFSI